MDKLLRDPFYGSLVGTYTPAEIKAAGWFPEAFELDYNTWLQTTPMHKLIRNYPQNPTTRPVVLISTGSFNPLHAGHLGMMESARKYLQSQGREVIAGYLSPSHDAYVSTKYPPAEQQSIGYRLKNLEQQLQNSDWLMIDAFEGWVCPGAINFSTVLLRLGAYLHHHLPQKPVDLVYVFGGDNAAFMRAFTFQGEGICVSRGGFQNIDQDPRLQNNPRCHFIPALIPAHEQLSSTNHRQQFPSPAPGPFTGDYFLRDDRDFIGQPLTSFFQEFIQQLTPLISGDLRIVPVNEQIKLLPRERKLYSLDPCLPSTHRLDFTRVFAVGDGQVASSTLIPRLEHSQSQLPTEATIEVIDDDIATGTTKKLLQELLAPTQITAWHTALEFYRQAQGLTAPVVDVIDFRDFFLGSPYGGLTVELPNQEFARVPYAWPYVRLTTRAKINPNYELAFALFLWRRWQNFYEISGQQLNDLPSAYAPWWKYLGFAPSTRVAEFCRQHVQVLEKLL